MAKIRFTKKNRPEIEVANGTNLMEALVGHSVPVASSCSGKLVCGKCYIQVTENSYNLSPVSSDERDFMEIKGIERGYRMACACQIEGDVELDTPYW